MRRNRFVPAAAAVALVAGLVSVIGARTAEAVPAMHSQPTNSVLPDVYPTPQSIHARGNAIPLGNRVGLVSDADSDPSAVAAVRALLTADGVRTIDEASDPSALRAGELAVVVGGQVAGSAVADPRCRRRLRPASGRICARRRTGRNATDRGSRRTRRDRLLLRGADPATDHHYARRRVPHRRSRGAGLAGTAGRGVIEGFYGTPWSQQNRLAQLNFYGAHKMNTYVYSPKDDPYLRAQWRDPYPPRSSPR